MEQKLNTRTHVLVGLTSAVAGKVFRIVDGAGDVIIGRSSSSTIQVNDSRVSRHHAKITRDASAPTLTVIDLDSAHGTFVNEKRVVGRMMLGDSDTLRLGTSVLLKCVALLPNAQLELENFSRLLEEAVTQVGAHIDSNESPPSVVAAREQMANSDRPPARMGHTYHLQCVRCGGRTPGRFDTLCPCGGMLDAVYDLARAELVDSDDPFVRFADLLPIRNRAIYPSTQYTPCIHAETLGRAIGIPWLYLKNETANPTGTTKDRASVIVLGMLLESGIERFATSSTGNAGTGYAYALRYPAFSSMEMHLFVGERYHQRVHYGDSPQVQVYALRDGSFEEAGALAAAYAKKFKMLSDGGFFSPGKREGAKLAFFEATEQVPRPIDWYVQSISSGLGVTGTFKGSKELRALRRIDRLPRLLCVQEETCSPQVVAWREGCETIQPHHIVHRPEGIALAIHRGDPSRAYPYIRAHVEESNGAYSAVTEAEIREACAMVRELEKIDICFNSGAAVAGVIREARSGVVSPKETVLLNLTGRDRAPTTATTRIKWLEYKDGIWVSDDGKLSMSEQSLFRRGHDRLRSEFPPGR